MQEKAAAPAAVPAAAALAVAAAVAAAQAPAPPRPAMCDVATAAASPDAFATLKTSDVACLLKPGLDEKVVGRLCQAAGFTLAQQRELIAAVAADGATPHTCHRETPGSRASARSAQPGFASPNPPTATANKDPRQRDAGSANSGIPRPLGAVSSSAMSCMTVLHKLSVGARLGCARPRRSTTSSEAGLVSFTL